MHNEVVMKDMYTGKVAEELNLKELQVAAAARLLAEGATVPFIARYRKEATGSLDEVAVIAIRDRLEQLKQLDARRETILKSLEEQEKLTDELQERIDGAETLSQLEDIYLPYRPKRRTRGTMAKEKGLEPLAEVMFAQEDTDPALEASAYVDAEKGVETVEDALAGARDIIAEWINENGDARDELRKLFAAEGVLSARIIAGKEDQGVKYKDYYDWKEPVAAAPSHRILAIRRGADEEYLSFRILPAEEKALAILEKRFVTHDGPASEQVRLAVKDGYKRLLSLAMETEIRLESKKRADEAAIAVFAENLRNLLMAPPLGQKAVMGVDPGLRTGCKVVCLDAQGKLLDTATIFPIEPFKKTAEAEKILKAFVARYDMEAIAVGNGTGGRETETFIRSIGFDHPVTTVMVNESGASVYSASKVARDEFPDYDVTVRGAVSIGRRLMDPLAELVKIDPKSIGVGQYQHDVDQGLLKRSLDDVVVSCVNAVGVEVNTASREILGYVSGLSERLAGNIIVYRNENGPFRSRKELLHVSGMGPKTFEQAAGFLRIRGGDNLLDASAVHPERYAVVEAMARNNGATVVDLMTDAMLRDAIRLDDYVTDTVGMPTLTDIMAELAKPGRDPREEFDAFSFADGVTDITDLEVGMQLPGIVTNVTAFGAFVDIGVHQDGLIHISHLADKYVKNPHDEVKVNQTVTVTVFAVDEARRRISLSMRKDPFADHHRKTEDVETASEKPRRGKKKREKPASPPQPETELGRALSKWRKKH